MADNKNVTNEAEVVTTPNGNDVTVVEKEGFFKKAGKFIKKHGKKIAIGAAGIGVGVLGYALGSKNSSSHKGSNSDDMIDCSEYDDPEFEEYVTNDDQQ